MFPFDPDCERPPSETGLCPMSAVHLLTDLGFDRGRALLMSEREAVAALGALCRDRWITALLRESTYA